MSEKKYSLVTSYLMDDVSRLILDERIKYDNDGDESHLQNIISTVSGGGVGSIYHPGDEKKLITDIAPYITDHSVVIYGAGVNGRKVYRLLKEYQIAVSCFFDQNHAQIESIDGIDVLPPTAEKCRDAVLIIAMERWEEAYDISEAWSPCRVFNFSDYFFRTSPKQYFEEPIIQLDRNESFIDGGAFNLETSLIFNDMCQAAGCRCHIVAVEPNEDNYMNCLFTLSKYPGLDIDLYKKWLSDKSNSEENIIAIDDMDLDEVSFIKMDISGWEMKALHGAQETIRKFVPKLAISVYHNRNDILDIPIYIKSIEPSYRLYLRHYSNTRYGTVLYAV